MCRSSWDEPMDIFQGSLLCPAQSPHTWLAASGKEKAQRRVPAPPQGIAERGWALVQALHTGVGYEFGRGLVSSKVVKPLFTAVCFPAFPRSHGEQEPRAVFAKFRCGTGGGEVGCSPGTAALRNLMSFTCPIPISQKETISAILTVLHCLFLFFLGGR